MKTVTAPVAETGPGSAGDQETEMMTVIIGDGAVIEIFEPGEMIHATAIAGAEMILLT